MPSELSSDQIKSETLKLLIKLIEICQLLNINYFLFYGSLIGAIRHRGYIPWDDDLDVAMLRPEFDKFVEYCRNNETSMFPYKLVGDFNVKDYPYNIPRFCNMDYRMETPFMKNTGMGLFIDIYPFDGVGSDLKLARKEFSIKKNLLHSCISYANGEFKPRYNKRIINYSFRLMLYLFARVIGPHYFKKKLYSFKDKHSLDESNYVECVVWSTLFKPIPKETFFNPITAVFEGITVSIPHNYDEVLTTIYGDYMTPPDENDRLPHHDYKIFKI